MHSDFKKVHFIPCLLIFRDQTVAKYKILPVLTPAQDAGC